MFIGRGITDLRDQAIADIVAATGYPTLLRRSPLRALAYSQAGLAYGHYGYLDWIARQSVPFSATGIFLEAWAALKGIYRVPATAATGTAALIGTGFVPSGSALRRGDNLSFVTTADLTLTGAGSVAIQAAETGSAYTIDDGTLLALAVSVAGVQIQAVATHSTPGTDPELDASLRTRMLLEWAAPAQGGDAADYLQWALAVPGVTRAWIVPLGMGSGTVLIYTMWDTAEATFLGFPQGTAGVASSETRDTAATGDLLAVANAVFPLRPATALVYSVAPTAAPVAFSIHPKTAVPTLVQPLVLAAIDQVFLALSSPLGVEIETGPFEAAIAAIPGMPDFTMTAPAGPITATLGYLPVRGTVTYA